VFKKHGIEFIVNSSFTKRNQEDIRGIQACEELEPRPGIVHDRTYGRGEEIMNELTSKETMRISGMHYRWRRMNMICWWTDLCTALLQVVPKRPRREGKFERRTLKFSTGGSKAALQAADMSDQCGWDVFPAVISPVRGQCQVQSFQEIWEDSELFKELRDFKKYKAGAGPVSISCLRRLQARAYSLHGDS